MNVNCLHTYKRVCVGVCAREREIEKTNGPL